MVDEKELIEKAKEASTRAYAPYSKFHVGAALLTESGKVFQGCNVENVSFGATNCAERTAIFSAVASGERKFKKIVIFVDRKETIRTSAFYSLSQCLREDGENLGEEARWRFARCDALLQWYA